MCVRELVARTNPPTSPHNSPSTTPPILPPAFVSASVSVQNAETAHPAVAPPVAAPTPEAVTIPTRGTINKREHDGARSSYAERQNRHEVTTKTPRKNEF